MDDGIGGYLHQYGHVPHRRDALLFREASREYSLCYVVYDVGEAHVEISHVILLKLDCLEPIVDTVGYGSINDKHDTTIDIAYELQLPL